MSRHFVRAFAFVAMLSGLLLARPAYSQQTGSGSMQYGAGSVNADSNLTVDPSTGVFRYSYPISLPPARGSAQPKLSVEYNSSGGMGPVGFGWGLSLPVIERRPPSGGFGPPTYGLEDRFAMNGQLLVRVCVVRGTACENAPNEQFPPNLSGWRFYRSAVEGSFVRLFFSPDSTIWIGQDKSGTTTVFGNAPMGGADNSSVDVDQASGQIYRWNVVAMSDDIGASTAPPYLGVNAITFNWAQLGPGQLQLQYLTDIYMTPGASGATDAAHHVHFMYASTTLGSQAVQPEPAFPFYAPIWLAKPDMVLEQISVWSATMSSLDRIFDRAYNFSYAASTGTNTLWGYTTLLSGITEEGRCSPATQENGNPESVTATMCPLLPGPTFSYGAATSPSYGAAVEMPSIPWPDAGLVIPADDAGTRVVNGVIDYAVPISPVMMDVNGDGISDILAGWEPNSFRPNSVVPNPPAQMSYLNSANGVLNSLVEQDIVPIDFTSIPFVGLPTAYLPSNYNITPVGTVTPLGVFPAALTEQSTPSVLFQQPEGGPCWGMYPYMDPSVPDAPAFWIGHSVACPNGAQPESSADAGYAPLWPWAVQYNESLSYVGLWPTPIDGVLPPTTLTYGDLDGDGVTDSAYGPTVSLFNTSTHSDPFGGTTYQYADYNVNGPVTSFLSQRAANGTTTAFQTGVVASSSSSPPLIGAAQNATTSNYALDNAQTVLADINGDGVDDFLSVIPVGSISWDNNQQWIYYSVSGLRVVVLPGTGDGKFDPKHVYDLEVSYTRSLSFHGVASGNGYSYWPVPSPLIPFTVADVTGDGLADIIAPGDKDPGWIWLFTGAPLDAYTTTLNGGEPYAVNNWDPSVCSIRAADMDGSGTNDIVTICPTGAQATVAYIPIAAGVTGRLLKTVNNGLGVTTQVTYDTTSHLSVLARAAGTPWTSLTPQPMSVVTSTSTSDNLPANMQENHVAYYTYANPVYDGLRRKFRGFTDVTVANGSPALGPQFTSVHTHYLVNAASTNFGETCSSTGACTLACYSNGDCPIDDINGLPVLVETQSSAGVYLSTVHTTYTMQSLYSGDDGYTVRFAYPSQTDTFKYDTASFASSPSPISLPEIDALSEPVMGTTASVTVQAAAAHLQTMRQIDNNGNELVTVDLGAINSATPDPTITTSKVWTTCGVSNGHWQLQQVKVTGSGVGTRESVYHDNPNCQLDHEWGNLSGSTTSATLGRSNAAGGQTAPFPSNAAVDGLVTLSTNYVYDAYGNLTSVTDADGSITTLGYDPLYNELLTTKTVYVVPPAVGKVIDPPRPIHLVTTTSWDRGFHEVTTTIDPNMNIVTRTLEAFGRQSSVTQPNGIPGSTATSSDTTVYTDLLNGPVQLAHSTQQIFFNTRESYIYYDGYGHKVLTLEQGDDPTNQCGGARPWIASGLPSLDPMGRVERTYQSQPNLYCGDPTAYPLNQTTGAASEVFSYDAFSRTTAKFAQDGTQTLAVAYHALSQSTSDERQLNSGYAVAPTTLTTQDGHGRTTQVKRAGNTMTVTGGSVAQTHELDMSYQNTGELLQIIESDPTPASGATITRSRVYDSLGRVVANTEPNSGTWRYAYDLNGNVVATSDPRGCGENIAYDSIGRVSTEDYSPCNASQTPYTPAPEATYSYDNGTNAFGKLVAVQDRATSTQFSYDIRGRTTQIAKELAAPSLLPPVAQPPAYGQHAFTKTFGYDENDALLIESSGADQAGLYGTALGHPEGNNVYLEYGTSGRLQAINGDYGTLIQDRALAPDGFLLSQVYGDAAQTALVTTAQPNRRRVASSTVVRGILTTPKWPLAPTSTYAPPSDPTTTLQRLLEQSTFSYQANQVSQVIDARNPGEWQPGAKPVSRTAKYDDFGRVNSVLYTYSGTGTGLFPPPDAFTSPLEYEQSGGATTTTYMPWQNASHRVSTQSIQYDSLGNTTATTDDANLFWDRSLGQISNGGSATASTAPGPNQLAAASNANGNLKAAYDQAGNLVQIAMTRAGTNYQFRYDWDEVGQLQRARRWDNAALTSYPTLPAATPVADLLYVYDAFGHRVMKQTNSNDAVSAEIFSTLRLEEATWIGTDYELSNTVEHVLLGAGGNIVGRINYDSTNTLPCADGNAAHVYLEITDHLGSTSSVIDRASGELVERTTYQAFGQVESDYRPARWQSFLEQYKYTGKEDDSDVGLTYFGARFYSAPLGRWASTDPKAVHALGADLNPYAFVHGQLMDTTDPDGLDDGGGTSIDLSAPVQMLGNPVDSGIGADGRPYKVTWEALPDNLPNFTVASSAVSDALAQAFANTWTTIMQAGRGFGFGYGQGVVPGAVMAAPALSMLPSAILTPGWNQSAAFMFGQGLGQIAGGLQGMGTGAGLVGGSGLMEAAGGSVAGPGGVAALAPVAWVTAGVGVGMIGNGIAAVNAGVASLASAAEGFEAIGSTGRVGEEALQALGGKSQVYFPTSQGGRFVDQLADGIAHESKVGYQSLTPTIARQIGKDAELLGAGRINGATWHFFQSPVTGLGGPSGPLREALEAAGISVEIH